uniref:Uncharacterized protein n=1 Tax=Panagrolaimus superbus TaxID=310955 RepID=A0A914XYD0_9BILA
MQFKASQKLLNPNDQSDAENEGGYKFFETFKQIYDSTNTFFSSYLPKMGIFDQFYEKAKSLFGESKEPYKKRDYYELLEVDIKATEDEIKRSYRKLALKYHPDKNIGKEEECAAYFTLLQQAYEVLMDPRERAFYDKHKDNILREQDATEEKKDEGIKLYEYFQPCFKGFGDDPQGFYSIYREVFDKLATEEFPYLDEDDEKMFPTFGRSDSDYDMIVAPFYDFWTNFSTSRTFAWLDKWNLRDAPNRATLRAMEKDNRKLRDAGKNERNDEIRSLAIYIRRRDKRVKAFREILEERKKKTQEEVEARRRQKLRENLEQLEEHVVNEEAMKEHLHDLQEIENQLDAEFGSVKKDNGDSGDEEQAEGQYCVVCEKGFKTSKSYANHLKSRKHKQELEELRKHMKEEDALLLQDEEEESDEKDDTPRRKGKSKKKRKKGKEEAEIEDTVAEEIDAKLNINVEEEADDEKKEELNVEEEVTKDEKVKPKGKNKKKNKGAEPKKIEVKSDGPTVPVPSECKICGLDFDSKTKLFKHIEATGHASLKTENPNQKQAGKKKGKK